ncbi:hypothetical protein Taro_055761 [Colocasia esculenta]|uniref:Protein kinase domain-containing protein n=1 Tax=Colocasia esculenta TaxID=4460 RepID=A0A843XV82_COLES|nr:hypothetical protein [Colocasia esculenta]
MAAAAESRLHGAADGEADLLMGGETGQGLGSSAGRLEEEAQVSSGAWSFSSSSTSSLASDVESDDGDSRYPLTQSEYEEIPSFRWIATPLRWWETKKKTHSKTNHKPRTRNMNVVFFDHHLTFTFKDLERAPTEVLGTGTYGSVHKATLGDGHQLAMRRLSCAIAENFEAEVNVLGKIRHPNILALRAYCTWPQGQKVLVSDYMPRGSLSAFLQGSEPADAISIAERMKMAIGITRGLHYLHTHCNMVHGNLTSKNILLDVDGDDDDDGYGARIADYGLLHLTTTAFGSNRTAAGGASDYRAPELPMLEKPNKKTDVYSLGVIILELLTGDCLRKAMDGWTPMWDVAGWLRGTLDATCREARRCMDRSPETRPEALDVLLRLQAIYARTSSYRTRAIGAEIRLAAKARREAKSADGSAGSADTTAVATPTTGLGITSLDIAKEGTSKDSQGNLEGEKVPNPTPAEEITCGGAAIEELPAQYLGDAGAHEPHSRDQSLTTETEETSAESVAPMPCHIRDIVANSPTAQLEGHDRLEEVLTNQEESGESKGIKGSDMTSGGAGISPLSSIDWSKVENMEVELQVPSTSPLISSEPDLIYQSYFQTLHKLANTSPPLRSHVLEGHLNRMVIGLHSMGYPLDEWTKAAILLLVSAKKREYIEHHVDAYKVSLEVQLKEFTSAINLVKEDMARTQSGIRALEQRNQELDETIAALKLEQEKVVDELTTGRDQLALSEAKAESISIDMDRVKQQHSATSRLRDEMLQELPSLDQVFDSAFQEIMAKKF